MFDTWQAQQKVQKDHERKAKTEAAAALQGYRKSVLSEEETKLTALREQERLQKMNAEQQLRGYRSQLTEDEARLAAQKQEELRKKQEYEKQLRNNGVVSAGGNNSEGLVGNSGAVSALAAEYSSPNKMQPLASKKSPTSTDSTEAVITDDGHAAPEEPQASTQLDSTSDIVPPALETLEVASSATPSTATDPPPPAHVAPTPKVYSSSVKFMFGILTGVNAGVSFPQDQTKLVEGYLMHADQIAKAVISDNNSSSSSFETILLSIAYPTASSVEKDECEWHILLQYPRLHSRTIPTQNFPSILSSFLTKNSCFCIFLFFSLTRFETARRDANRLMVTVTIAFTAPDRETSTDFKTQVIARVRSAISAGKFTKLDR